MNSRINDDSDGIDRKTSRSICDAVGERLQQSLRPETSGLSSHLQHLMDDYADATKAAGRTRASSEVGTGSREENASKQRLEPYRF